MSFPQCGGHLVIAIKVEERAVERISSLHVNGISSLRPVDRYYEDGFMRLLRLDGLMKEYALSTTTFDVIASGRQRSKWRSGALPWQSIQFTIPRDGKSISIFPRRISPFLRHCIA
jgi:hypothetical protein